MYFRKIPHRMLDAFRRNLEANARREPLDVTYYCDLNINGVQYCLRLVMQRSKIYPFQAIRLDKDIRNCELITRPIMLVALTEVLLEQYAANNHPAGR